MAIQTILSKGLSIGLAAVGPIIGRIVPMSPIVANGLSIRVQFKLSRGIQGLLIFPKEGPIQ